jgi:transglutaminase-like putative cysteine protease
MTTAAPAPRGPRAARARPGSAVRLTAFAGLIALAAWRYAGIELHPPAIRIVALVLIAVVAGPLLTFTATDDDSARGHRRIATRRAALIGLLFILVLLVAGIPARLLLPMGWGTLVRGMNRGLDTIASTLWPYAGHDRWARLDILVALAVLTAAATALGCVPATAEKDPAGLRSGLRRVGALVLLLTVYVIGVIDANAGSIAVDGLLILALLAGWLWLPGLRVRRTATALIWLAAAGGVAIPLARALSTSQAWFDYRAWNLLGSGTVRTAFSWDQTYGPIPWSRSQRPMFTVRAPRSGLWKVTTLDRFDGLRFVRSGTEPSRNEDLPLPLNDRWYEFATFRLVGLSTRLLPTLQGTTAAVTIARPVRYDQDGTVTTLARPLRSGESYTVLAYVPRPSEAELRAAPRAFPAPYLRYTAFDLPGPGQTVLRLARDPPPQGEYFTRRTVGGATRGRSPAAAARARRLILASPYASVYRLAHQLASGLRSTYDVALAIENNLKANYAYSEQSPRRRYPLAAFLFTDRIGYCQQFSGAMALMLRMDGIPARVAAGFLPGSYDASTRSYQVRAVDAHSWVEVYFTGIGWVPFDPTPARTVGPPLRPVYASSSVANPAQAIALTVGGALPLQRGPIQPAPRRQRSRGSVVGWAAVFAVAVLGLAALLAAAARWLVGSSRLRRSLHGDGELATRELAGGLRSMGYAVTATATLAQIEGLVRLHGGEDAARYVRLLRERRYGRHGGARPTLRDRRRLRHALTAHLGLDARLRGHWALPPGTLGWRLPSPVQLPAAGGPKARSLARATPITMSTSRAASCTPPIAIAGQPRKLNTLV